MIELLLDDSNLHDSKLWLWILILFFPIKNSSHSSSSVLHDKFFGFKKSFSVSLKDNCSELHEENQKKEFSNKFLPRKQNISKSVSLKFPTNF